MVLLSGLPAVAIQADCSGTCLIRYIQQFDDCMAGQITTGGLHVLTASSTALSGAAHLQMALLRLDPTPGAKRIRRRGEDPGRWLSFYGSDWLAAAILCFPPSKTVISWFVYFHFLFMCLFAVFWLRYTDEMKSRTGVSWR